MKSVKYIPLITGATATQTTEPVWVGDYDKVAIVFKRANHGSGSTALSVQGALGQLASDSSSLDFVAYNMLVDNVTNTNAQTLTRVASKSLSANGSALVWLDEDFPVTHIKVTLTETTDGTHTAYLVGFCD